MTTPPPPHLRIGAVAKSTAIMDELREAMAELERKPPATPWNGEVYLDERFMPYEACDPKTGERHTVHAVVIAGVLICSRRAWDALKAASEARP